MHAEETQSGSNRFEPLHLALSSPHRLRNRAAVGAQIRRDPDQGRERNRFAPDSPLEGDGFELSVPRVMGGRFRTTVPAAIAFSRWPARRLRCRGTKLVGPDRHPEFRDETYDGQLLGLWTAIVLIGEVRESKIRRFRPKS
jgi:hypothetical protein